ncbi:hypothetical protein IWQ51_001083 [Labrenzia sp. EL_142]|nr:hypothetical protein [Labrenzia sp. EL_142]
MIFFRFYILELSGLNCLGAGDPAPPATLVSFDSVMQAFGITSWLSSRVTPALVFR